ncbi:MetQ/NlpA family ABC transporter substrate-binding protein [Salirhabdus salicampi]|uniref:MetQ/NlpA family ABC transporter substrate-binding protein n=1 Tax=Salirhabdus salicampi TaxID=476102 RepID=UPI0020C26D30|nr:MetQ/NlpA family ABC transporter substrate-binding protein [Salirhabdus salicampi]MCP8615821.1 MetQ/NlpA family ABC transporter substrate-binding protein [Salirhabdus salicampi]
MKKGLFTLLAVLLLTALTACGSDNASGDSEDKKEIVFGATVGPYSDMVTKAIKPILEEKGYTVDVVEFSDYVQPNKSLANGSLDANLFQHKIYLDAFSAEHNLDLSEVIIVPTAPMGIYSNKFDSIEDIEEGSEIAIASDPTNLARTLLILEAAGLIKISEDVDPLKASEKDVVENYKNLKLSPIEAAQLPRAVETVDLSAVPGNFALAADMNLLDALALEEMPDDYRNRVAVRTEDLDAQFVKDIEDAIKSVDFEATIDEQFKGFGKPAWMLNR